MAYDNDSYTTLHILDLKNEKDAEFYAYLQDLEMYIISMKSQNKPLLGKYGDLLSIADLVDLFGVSKQTIYKELKQGKFGTPICIGREYKVPKTYIWNKFFLNYK